MTSDADLLGLWRTRRDEAAFRGLCAQHAGLVAAVAQRLGSPDREEAAQAVFLLLARRATSVDGAHLAGWLTLTTRRVVANQRRSRDRRQRHEEEAAMAQARQRDGAAAEPVWSEARQHLDDALASLSAGRREAVVRFYLQGRPQAEVAAELGCSVDAVKTRVHEALERLRSFFARRGVALGAAALASGLGSETASAEPAIAGACAQAVLVPGSAAGAATLATGVATAMVVKTTVLAVACLLIGSALTFAVVAGETPPPLPVPGPEPAPAPAPFLTAQQRSAIMALYDQAVMHGFPEARGASFLSGMLRTRRGGGSMGIHMRSSDGRWVVQEKLVASDQIEAGGLQPVQSLLAEHALRTPDISWLRGLELLTETDRPQVIRAASVLHPVNYRMSGESCLFALRADLPGADAAWTAYNIPYGGLIREDPGVAPGMIQLGGELKEHLARWRQRFAGKVHPADPVARAGQLLREWFMNQLITEQMQDELTPAGCLAGALAVTDPALHQGLRRYVDALAACDAVPIEAPANADLAMHVCSWQWLRSTRFGRWWPSESDLPGLMALLDDQRPARRWGGPPIICGDLALRAISRILGFDPRWLVRRDVDAQWTEAERTATIASLRSWWQQVQGRSLADVLAAEIGTLPPVAQVAILAAAPTDRQQQILGRIAAAWTGVPPDPAVYADPIASILGLGDGHPAFPAMVRSWPADWPAAPLLACWYDRHGEPSRLDDLVSHALGNDATRSNAIGLLLSAPESGRLGRLLPFTTLPVDDPRLWTLISCMAEPRPNGHWGAAQTYLQRVSGDPVNNRPRTDTHAALGIGLLDDQRTLPASAIALETSHPTTFFHHTLMISGRIWHFAGASATRHETPPTGLRVCDVVTILHDPVDPWAGRAALDDAAAGLRERWGEAASRARKTAGIPDPPAAPSGF